MKMGIEMGSRVLMSVIAAAALFCNGCATPPVQPAMPAVNMAAVIHAEFQRSVAAWNAGNLDAFVAVYAEEATFALPDGLLEGRAAIRDFYAPLFAPGAIRDELTLDPLHVEMLSPEVALVRGVYRNSHLGQVTRMGPTTLIIRRQFEGWRIIHDHSS